MTRKEYGEWRDALAQAVASECILGSLQNKDMEEIIAAAILAARPFAERYIVLEKENSHECR